MTEEVRDQKQIKKKKMFSSLSLNMSMYKGHTLDHKDNS